jgi:hypothetical protein
VVVLWCFMFFGIDFAKDIQPVLAVRCMPCHSGASAQAGLKAHTRDELLRGGVSGPAIIPGKGSESLLVQKIEGTNGMRMPPSGPPLPAETIARIRMWIDEGAKFDGLQAISEHIAPLAPRTPRVPAGSASHPIDRFLRSKGNVVSDSAFARRAWYDLIGLPPTPRELRTLDKDRARIIDALLANRRAFAEHWISYWNDLLRNDEGVIYHGERTSITTWLLAALEHNMPYDRMVRELLDPAPKTGPEGFLVGMTWRGVISASQTPPMQAAQNAAQVFLGINLKCAACHDSFINRWKLKDTYGLANMFSDGPLQIVRCDVRTGKASTPLFPYPELHVSFDDTRQSRRAAAARWFTHPDNGRFARTIVNRYWKLLMGRGIVEPADDMDAEPSNADLLDWLASDFAANGYDLQHLLRRIMTSQAYQLERVSPRRLTAEQFADTISAVTGDWRVTNPRAENFSTYTREWRLKSDPLSRALGRPIRDQVYTERSTAPTTLQALELTNGPLLSKRLERGAKSLLGELPAAPANLFDSKSIRAGPIPVDVQITGATELWLLVEDVDSYDAARVRAGWVDATLIGPDGAVKLDTSLGDVPSSLRIDVAGKGYTRFQARALVDEKTRASDIGPNVRFFAFGEKPNPDQLIRVQGRPPRERPKTSWTGGELVGWLYQSLLARNPTPAERRIAENMVGARPSAAGVEDLLWAILMSSEFQYVR